MARVLIVDDSFVARKALGKILTELGHTVVGEAADGVQAFAEYSRYQPDIVTMDLTMPEMDGTEATAKIIATFPEARIIVISASEERQVVLDALEKGARHYIIKPITPEKVTATINNVLEQNIDPQRYRAIVQKLKDAASIADELKHGLADAMCQAARILIVDDSAVARKCLREIAAELGHTVVGEAENGAQAFVEYTRCRPDIVTMDLTMQGMSGAEATSKIIATYPEARIVVISAFEERRVIIDALERGARHFIIKPIDRDKVAAVLCNVLRQDFDRRKHLDLVRRLKATEASASPLDAVRHDYQPPYQICVDNRLTLISIGANLSLTSCQSLAIELEEYLEGEPRVLLDFGMVARLDEAVLAEIDRLIQTIEKNSGVVRAASRSQVFVDLVNLEAKVPTLAATLQFLAG